MNKVDILAIGAHPDDIELGAGGTLIKHRKMGYKIGLCDLTQGELGTRGSGSLRLQEAEAARKVLGAEFRVNLGMADGFFQLTDANKLEIIKVIRASRPRILIANALSDRHPDHGRGAQLTKEAAFLSGLRRIETTFEGNVQEAWRPEIVMHYVQDYFQQPNFVVDVSQEWDEKIKAIMAFSSQFFDPNSKEPASPISSKEFMGMVDGRGLQYGRYVGGVYGEGFQMERPSGVRDIMQLD